MDTRGGGQRVAVLYLPAGGASVVVVPTRARRASSRGLGVADFLDDFELPDHHLLPLFLLLLLSSVVVETVEVIGVVEISPASSASICLKVLCLIEM